MRTHVSTYTVVEFADPYKQCRECGEWVEGVRVWAGDKDEGRVNQNHPCGHRAGYDDTCPSWSPVDGCSCVEFLGSKEHPEP